MTGAGIQFCFCGSVDNPDAPEQHEIGCLHAAALAFWYPKFAEAAPSLRSMLWGPNRRPNPPVSLGGCYEAPFGWVHVKPGCHCPH